MKFSTILNSKEIEMINLMLFVLTISAASTKIERVESTIVGSLFEDLKNLSSISYNLILEHVPEDLSLEEAIKSLGDNIAEVIEIAGDLFEPNSKYILDDMNRELTMIYDFPKFHQNLGHLDDIIIHITSEFKRFKVVFDLNLSTDILLLDEYFSGLIQSSNIPLMLKNIDRIVHGHFKKTPNLFSLMSKYFEDYGQKSCSNQKLTQAHVQNFYKVISNVEFCGSFMLISAYAHLTRRRLDNHHHLIKETMRVTAKRLSSYSKKARTAMKRAPLEILACDNETYVRNKNYIGFSGMKQGFVLDSGALNPEVRDCQLSKLDNDHCTTRPDLCFRQYCSSLDGQLSECLNIHATKLQVCGSHEYWRRYSWIKSEKATYGNYTLEQTCSPIGPEQPVSQMLKRIDSNEDSQFVNREYCFCECKRAKWMPNDIRMISLHWESANTNDNRVVTNLRFKEKDGLIHLNIQTGRILRGGMIDQASVYWKDDYPSYFEYDPETESPIYVFNQTHHGESYVMYKWIIDRDFAYLSNDLTMFLDDFMVPENHVIVGVKLIRSLVQEVDHTRINLQVQTMEFNYTSGKMNKRNYTTMSSPSSIEGTEGNVKRKPVNLGAPGDPAKLKENNSIISENFQSVKFQLTDWKKDLGQTIVPLIDTRPLMTGLAHPLSGVGLYFRGCENDCGGFIAPRIFLYNYTEHFEREYENSYLPGDYEE